MPRIRSIKPEIVADVKLSSVSRDARLTFIYMITQADDIGLLAGAPRQLVGTLYPLDETVTAPMLLTWIDELVTGGIVRRRATRDGVPVLEITNWSKHQRVDNAGRSQLGALLAESPDDLPQTAEGHGDPPRDSATRGLDHRPPITDLGSPTTDQGPPTAQDVSAAALALSVAANRGLLEHSSRPQRIPKINGTSGRTHSAAEEILKAGVPLEFAEAQVYELARTHNADGQVSTLGYFVAATIRAWVTKQDADRATNGKHNGNGRHGDAKARARVLFDLAKCYDLFTWIGNAEEYAEKQLRAAADPRAGDGFLEEIKPLRLHSGVGDSLNDNIAIAEIAKRIETARSAG